MKSIVGKAPVKVVIVIGMLTLGFATIFQNCGPGYKANMASHSSNSGGIMLLAQDEPGFQITVTCDNITPTQGETINCTVGCGNFSGMDKNVEIQGQTGTNGPPVSTGVFQLLNNSSASKTLSIVVSASAAYVGVTLYDDGNQSKPVTTLASNTRPISVTNLPPPKPSAQSCEGQNLPTTCEAATGSIPQGGGTPYPSLTSACPLGANCSSISADICSDNNGVASWTKAACFSLSSSTNPVTQCPNPPVACSGANNFSININQTSTTRTLYGSGDANIGYFVTNNTGCACTAQVVAFYNPGEVWAKPEPVTIPVNRFDGDIAINNISTSGVLCPILKTADGSANLATAPCNTITVSAPIVTTCTPDPSKCANVSTIPCGQPVPDSCQKPNAGLCGTGKMGCSGGSSSGGGGNGNSCTGNLIVAAVFANPVSGGSTQITYKIQNSGPACTAYARSFVSSGGGTDDCKPIALNPSGTTNGGDSLSGISGQGNQACVQILTDSGCAQSTIQSGNCSDNLTYAGGGSSTSSSSSSSSSSGGGRTGGDCAGSGWGTANGCDNQNAEHDNCDKGPNGRYYPDSCFPFP